MSDRPGVPVSGWLKPSGYSTRYHFAVAGSSRTACRRWDVAPGALTIPDTPPESTQCAACRSWVERSNAERLRLLNWQGQV